MNTPDFAKLLSERISGEWTDIRFHLPYLFFKAASYEQVQIMECGTRRANSTVAFLAAAQKTNGHLWSYDINMPEIPETDMKNWTDSGLWTFTQGDDLAHDDDAYPDKVDILFIDSGHELYATLVELRRFVPLVKPGGVILLHDVCYAVSDMKGMVQNTYGPVAWALDEYCREDERTPERWWHAYPGSYGLGELCP